jgi:hypothetical protein
LYISCVLGMRLFVLFNELLLIKKNVSTTIKESAVSILIMAYVMLINKNTLDVYISII